MTNTVLLVRHGQTDSNVKGIFMGRSDENINETGRIQARKLSERLADSPITAIYTSPLRRTHTTAAILATPHNLELKLSDDLIEIQTGDWQGLRGDEISRKWPELWRQSRIDPSDFAMPNGESFRQVTERAVRAYEMIVAQNQGKQAVIVTHDIVVRVIVAHILGTSNSIYRRFEIGNASLSQIRLTDDKARLVTLNDTSHLDGLG